jgi:hypothetical protein
MWIMTVIFIGHYRIVGASCCYPSGAKNLDMTIRFFKSFVPLFGVRKEHEMLVAEFIPHYLWKFNI